MNVLPITIVIPKFVRKIKLSEKQRPAYFEWNGSTIKGKGKRLPLSFFKDKSTAELLLNNRIEDLKDEYVIALYRDGKIQRIFRDTLLLPPDPLGKLYLAKTDEPDFSPYELVIANPKKVGTPKYYLIKGQDIYSGNLREHQKGLVMDKIKESYLPYVKDIPIIDSYPVKITCELHETIKNFYDRSKELGQRWDIDNYIYLYTKAFPDLLVSLGKLKDDDRLHFPSNIPVIFIPVADHEDRKFVFIISKDDRAEIKNNLIYQEYHKSFNAGFHRNEITNETEDNELRDLEFEESIDENLGVDPIVRYTNLKL